MLVTQLCLTLCDPMDYTAQPTRLFCPWISLGKNIGMSCHFLLQGIFLTQGSNPGLLHCRQMLYPLSHAGMYPEETIIEKDTCTKRLTAALFTIARTWKQPRCSSADKWIRKCGTYTQWSITQLLKIMHLNHF